MLTKEQILEMSKTKEFDAELKRIYNYIASVLYKQGRILNFSDIYGDGTIYSPFSKKGAKMFYSSMLEAIGTTKEEIENYLNK